MAFLHRSGEKRKSLDEYVKEEESMDQSMDIGGTSPKHHHPLDSEKRMRREIANSNERRRMQSINAGFESLKSIIPHHDGEKLSKAAILQQTTEYITNLESEKTRLLSQNGILRQMLKELKCDPDAVVGPISEQITPPPKRKKRDTESSDEGISLGFDEPHIDELKKEVIELRVQLERERKLRMYVEEKHQRTLASHHSSSEACKQSSDKLRAIANQVMETQIKEEKKLPTEVSPAPTKASPSLTQLPASPKEAEKEQAPAAPPPQPTAPRVPVFASSMSKRNLETIVEAIRHLEGDHIMCDLWKDSNRPHNTHIPQSEESQPESSSDAEDLKSESSGRDSPPLCSARPVTVVSRPEATSTLHITQVPVGNMVPVAAPVTIVDKWHLLPPATGIVSRPGVIVQKSS